MISRSRRLRLEGRGLGMPDFIAHCYEHGLRPDRDARCRPGFCSPPHPHPTSLRANRLRSLHVDFRRCYWRHPRHTFASWPPAAIGTGRTEPRGSGGAGRQHPLCPAARAEAKTKNSSADSACSALSLLRFTEHGYRLCGNWSKGFRVATHWSNSPSAKGSRAPAR